MTTTMMDPELSLSAGIKSLLLEAWRERWSEEKWSVAMKRFMPYISTMETFQLSGKYNVVMLGHICIMLLLCQPKL